MTWNKNYDIFNYINNGLVICVLKDSKRYIVYLITAICVLFCISIAIVLLYKKLVPVNGVNESDVILTKTVKNLKMTAKLAVSDEFGKNIKESSGSYIYYNFECENISNYDHNYQVFITKDERDLKKEINFDYVKFYLTDNYNNPVGIFDSNLVPTYRSLSYIEDKPDSKIIYTGEIKKGQKKKFVLRVWLADNYIVTDDVHDFSFSLGVRAV